MPFEIRLGCLVLVQLFCLTTAQAKCVYFDGFKDNGNGTITDPRSGLIWQKCSIGQTWKGSSCVGEASSMNWATAMEMAKSNRFLNKNTWRVPTKAELMAVVGHGEACEDVKPVASSALAVPVTSDGYLGVFWTSTLNEASNSGAWDVSFVDGYVGVNFRYSNYNVRLVANK